MTRVVHLTSVHPADDNRIVHKECRSLAARGYEVFLVAASEHTAQVPGVEVVQVDAPRDRTERLTQTVPEVLRRAIILNADLYHFHDPELLVVGLVLKAMGKRVIYDAHEDVPKQVQAKSYIRPAVRRLLPPVVSLVEKGIARRLDAVVTATERVAGKFVRPRSAAVHNFPRISEFPSQPRAYAQRQPHMAYVGAIDKTRGLNEMVAAIASVRQAVPQARLKLAGRVRPGLQVDAAGVDWLGHCSRGEVATLLDEVSIGLCVLHPTPAYVEAIPTKVLEYMAAGTAVVSSDFPYWRELFGDTAVYVDPTDATAVADAVTSLLQDPPRAAHLAEAGRALACSKYNWDAEAQKLFDLYAHVLGEDAADSPLFENAA